MICAAEVQVANLLNETSGLMAFVRTVEAGSFSAAARDLATTPSAVSKSVARLEKKIGTRLFLRSTRALTLTQDGQVFFDRVAPLLRDLDSSDEAIRSDASPSGRLRISMPSELAPLLLPRLFSSFAADHPNLHLDIGTIDETQSLQGRVHPRYPQLRQQLLAMLIAWDLAFGSSAPFESLKVHHPIVSGSFGVPRRLGFLRQVS